jgi:hypothetical protein
MQPLSAVNYPCANLLSSFFLRGITLAAHCCLSDKLLAQSNHLPEGPVHRPGPSAPSVVRASILQVPAVQLAGGFDTSSSRACRPVKIATPISQLSISYSDSNKAPAATSLARCLQLPVQRRPLRTALQTEVVGKRGVDYSAADDKVPSSTP